jgi:monoamine oxidase
MWDYAEDMETAAVVVVGGGAAGLAAFQKLRAAGCEAVLVEASERLGGRIHTLHPAGWPLPVELGAEFIHGPADGLGLAAAPAAPGRDWSSRDGGLHAAGEFAGGAEAVFERMAGWQGPDLGFAAFLDTCGDLDAAARAGAAAFIEGYEAADPARISVAALNREFAAEGGDPGPPRRPLGGYDRLPAQLHADGRLRLSWPVAAVAWREGEVLLTGPGGETMAARRAILTLPLSLLQREAVRFDPPLAAKRPALDRLAMGGALRITLRLRRAFWQEVRDSDGQRLEGLRFLFGSASESGHFPTWWTHAVREQAQIVGWAGGRHAWALAGRSAAALRELACADLAARLGVEPGAVAREVVAAHVHDWQTDPWSLGAYSYATVGGADAFAELARPLRDTLFFAGEATEAGGHHATVPGAVASGRRAAAEVLAGV